MVEVQGSVRVKPKLRGVSQEFAVLAALAGCAVLFRAAPSPRAMLAAATYGASLVTLFAASALYHRPTWALARAAGLAASTTLPSSYSSPGPTCPWASTLPTVLPCPAVGRAENAPPRYRAQGVRPMIPPPATNRGALRDLAERALSRGRGA